MVALPTVPIDQRFAQLIQQFGLTKNSFAISLGKTASVVQHLIDGRNKPGYDLLCRVFEVYPNVSRDWLLLGRGPMLVGGDLPAKVVPLAHNTAFLDPPLEPIDLTDVAPPLHRRAVPGVAGSRLQPAEIAATIALATANSSAPRATPDTVLEETPELVSSIHIRPAPAAVCAPEPVRATARDAVAAPLPAAEATTAPVPAVAGPAAMSPETYVAAALHAQHLQHQLALAELRNQHLLDQQQMLREMLAMARQSMV